MKELDPCPFNSTQFLPLNRKYIKNMNFKYHLTQIASIPSEAREIIWNCLQASSCGMFWINTEKVLTSSTIETIKALAGIDYNNSSENLSFTWDSKKLSELSFDFLKPVGSRQEWGLTPHSVTILRFCYYAAFKGAVSITVSALRTKNLERLAAVGLRVEKWSCSETIIGW